MAGALAACIDNGVRVAVLKVGSSEAGGRAAAAHTGAIAGDQRVFRALVEEAGAAWAADPHELLELARVLAVRRADPRTDRGPGSGPAILTCSGGDSGNAADLAEENGIDLPELAPHTIERLTELLPEAATPGNPLDYTSLLWFETGVLTEIVAVVGRDPSVDQLLLFHDHPRDLRPEHDSEWADVRRALAAGAVESGAPALFSSTLPDLVDEDAIIELGEIDVPVVGGMAAAISVVRASRRPTPSVERLERIAKVASGIPEEPGDWLGEAASKELLRKHGIAVPEGGTAMDTAAALEVAGRVGWPVALKLSAPGIRHKSESKAMTLDVSDGDQLIREVVRLFALPTANGATLLVERMLDPGLELIVSAAADSVVPTLVVGLGGIWTELIGDAAVIPLPAGPEQIQEALLGLKAAPLLTGARGTDPVDLEALADLAAKVGRILIEEKLSLIELNPVIVSTKGAVATDAIARN